MDARLLAFGVLVDLIFLFMVLRSILSTPVGKVDTLSFFVPSRGEFSRPSRPLRSIFGPLLALILRIRRAVRIFRGVRLYRRLRMSSLRRYLIFILGLPFYTGVLLIILNLFLYTSR